MKNIPLRFGVIGCGYGSAVLVPAIRLDTRAQVVALASTNFDKVNKIANDLSIPSFYNSWNMLLEHSSIDVLAVAVPPKLQPLILNEAMKKGIAFLAEKPLCTNLRDAQELFSLSKSLDIANVIDFNFSALPAFIKAKNLLDSKSIGRLRHILINWHVENYSNRNRLENWKANTNIGGGTLFNFVAHCFQYIEWLVAEPIIILSARLWPIPGDRRPSDATVALQMDFASQLAAVVCVSAASPLGSGHEIVLYGENGYLRLSNTTSDYMRGFKLIIALRDQEPQVISLPDESPVVDGRILPTGVLVTRLIDQILGGQRAYPNLLDGLRAQELIEAAQISNTRRQWVKV